MPVTSGTTQTYGGFRLQNSNQNTLDFGWDQNKGAWIQTGYAPSLIPGNTYSLLLNPNGGKVGIGTDAPNEELHIEAANPALRLKGTATDGRVDIYLQGDTKQWNIKNDADNFYIRNDTDGVMAMTIDTSGNVGIGETNPSSPLEITKTGAGVQNLIKLNNNRGNSQADADGCAILVEGAIADNADATTYGKLECKFDDVSQGTIDSSWRFTNYVGNNATEVLSLVGGNVGIGTPNPTVPLHVQHGTSSWSARLQNTASSNPSGLRCVHSGVSNGGTSYFFQFEDSNGDRARCTGNGSFQSYANSYGSTSDIRSKTDIKDATDKLADLNKVKIKNFKKQGDDTKQIGVIADELEEIFPTMIELNDTRIYDDEGELVRGYEDEKSVKYSVFVPMLVKAVQELSAKVTALENA
jgi:hypothetical protein